MAIEYDRQQHLCSLVQEWLAVKEEKAESMKEFNRVIGDLEDQMKATMADIKSGSVPLPMEMAVVGE